MKDAGLACGSGWFSPVHQSLNISQFHLFIFPIAHGRLTRFHKSVLCITITYRIPVVKHVKISGEKKCSTTPFLDLRIKAGYNIGKNYEKTVSHTVARGILMKKNIATLPLIEAFRADDECPFCYLERAAQQHAISFILGSAYMEDYIREKTDALGFCRHHYKMMYDYGNRLGSALILSTHLKKLNQEFEKQISGFAPGKSTVFKRIKPARTAGAPAKTPLGAWLDQKEQSCYVCDYVDQIYNRYLDTFFDLYRKNEEFRTLFEQGKGFCLPHYRDLVECAQDKLTETEKQTFFQTANARMLEHLKRLENEVTWFVDKNDYRNKEKDWGNSADSVQRAMQKCSGGYPADPVFKQEP